MPIIIGIEIYLKKNVIKAEEDLVSSVHAFCFSKPFLHFDEKIIHALLPQSVEFIRVTCDSDHKVESMTLGNIISGSSPFDIKYYTATLEDNPASEEMPCDELEGATASNTSWVLPCRELDGSWECLYFDGNIKQRLLRYAITSLQLGRSGVNPNIILCNRLILLHGPPGTGKTTVCRALAQKLSVRLIDIYSQAQLIEVNCHSLFSKWFSESGKLVSRMFSGIRQLAQDSNVLIVIVIDEVESLTAARQSAINGTEPSDAIRVVNAVLTQLDSLRFLPNVLVLATSNLTDAIDEAFTDRADIIQLVPPPGVREISQILESCFAELERANIFEDGSCPTNAYRDHEAIATRCLGLSGRTIRKLPVMALAETLQNVKTSAVFRDQMLNALESLLKDRDLISRKQTSVSISNSSCLN